MPRGLAARSALVAVLSVSLTAVFAAVLVVAGADGLVAVVIASAVGSVGAVLSAQASMRSPVSTLTRLTAQLADLTGAPLPATNPDEITRVVAGAEAVTAEYQSRIADVEREHHRLAEAFALAGDAVLALDESGAVAFLNPAAERLFQVRSHDAFGNGVIRVTRDHEIDNIVRRALGGERSSSLIEFGPQRQYLRVTAAPASDRGEWAAVVIFSDLTEVRRLEAMRRDFVSSVSHELRTPLASIRAMVETLDAGAIDDREAAVDFLGRIQEEVDRVTTLVDELLELSRLESGSSPLNIETVTAATLLDEAARRMRPQAERAGLHLETADSNTEARVDVDAERIRRALVSLLHNAVKFTPPGGTIRTWVDREGGTVRLHVADTGVGIAHEDQPRVFERFYKADKSRGGGGTGLGLAIVKHTAQAHGGSVRLESLPGKGSEFVIELPAARQV